MPERHRQKAGGNSAKVRERSAHLGRMLGPGTGEVFVPRQQSARIIGTEVVEIFHHEPALESLEDPGQVRDLAIRENIFCHPGINTRIVAVAANGVE